jgi:hypothetical protein
MLSAVLNKRCIILILCITSFVLFAQDKDTCLTSAASFKSIDVPSPLNSIIDYYSQSGFSLRDSISGDLNKDSLIDMVLLLDKKGLARQIEINSIEPRTVIILCGTGVGLYKEVARNDSAALCKTCGDTLSDPYLKTVIKKGSFSIEQQGQYLIKWKRVNTFKYIETLHTWVLNQDGIVSENNGNKFKVIKTLKDFGNIPFDRFNIYNFDEYLKNIPRSKIIPISFNASDHYMHWQMVKGGIWDVLNYSTGRTTKGYIEFFKSNGEYIENPNEDLSLIYDIYTNLKVPDSTFGLAIRNIPSFNPANVKKGRFDSTSNTYTLGSDTLRFPFSPEFDTTTNKLLLKIIRNHKTYTLKVRGEYFGVDFCGDLNGDGYLDFVASENNSNCNNTVLHLSQKVKNGNIYFIEAAFIAFSD